MSNDKEPNATIVLFGLEESLAMELRRVLTNQHQAVHSEPFVSGAACLRQIEKLGAEMAFCSAERERYIELLDVVVANKPDFPVVIVSRTPEVSEWLDAIEAGASDYCAAPFESSHIKWILDSNLKHQAPATRYRTATH